MALWNFNQLKQQVAQQAGIQDSNGTYNFDDSTFPTEQLAEDFINQSIKETTSSWDYTFLQSSRSYPFYHTISGVQSLYLSGVDDKGSGINTQATITPYPSSVLNYSWISNNTVSQIQSNFSGIYFSGVSSGVSYSSISNYGTPTTANYNGLGYTYQLDQDIDKIIACVISQPFGQTANGIVMTSVEWHDIERMIPIGIINASGTPVYYSEFPGFGPINNKTIQFFPFPVSGFVGQNFIIHYKKKHVDLIQDTDVQSVVPEQYQSVIVNGALEKVFDLLDNPKSILASQRKMDLENKMRVWDAQQPNKMWVWEDYTNYNTPNSAFITTPLVWIPND